MFSDPGKGGKITCALILLLKNISSIKIKQEQIFDIYVFIDYLL